MAIMILSTKSHAKSNLETGLLKLTMHSHGTQHITNHYDKNNVEGNRNFRLKPKPTRSKQSRWVVEIFLFLAFAVGALFLCCGVQTHPKRRRLPATKYKLTPESINALLEKVKDNDVFHKKFIERVNKYSEACKDLEEQKRLLKKVSPSQRITFEYEDVTKAAKDPLNQIHLYVHFHKQLIDNKVFLKIFEETQNQKTFFQKLLTMMRLWSECDLVQNEPSRYAFYDSIFATKMGMKELFDLVCHHHDYKTKMFELPVIEFLQRSIKAQTDKVSREQCIDNIQTLFKHHLTFTRTTLKKNPENTKIVDDTIGFFRNTICPGWLIEQCEPFQEHYKQLYQMLLVGRTSVDSMKKFITKHQNQKLQLFGEEFLVDLSSPSGCGLALGQYLYNDIFYSGRHSPDCLQQRFTKYLSEESIVVLNWNNALEQTEHSRHCKKMLEDFPSEAMDATQFQRLENLRVAHYRAKQKDDQAEKDSNTATSATDI